MFNRLISLKRDIILDSEPTIKEEEPRSISLEAWLKEFNVGSKVVNDTDTEQAMEELKKNTEKKYKELIIRNSQKYCRLNHTTKTL